VGTDFGGTDFFNDMSLEAVEFKVGSGLLREGSRREAMVWAFFG